jgi:hypothetical protein
MRTRASRSIINPLAVADRYSRRPQHRATPYGRVSQAELVSAPVISRSECRTLGAVEEIAMNTQKDDFEIARQSAHVKPLVTLRVCLPVVLFRVMEFHQLRRHEAILLFAVIAVAWGTAWPVIKAILQDLSPLWAMVLRSAIGTATFVHNRSRTARV